MFQRSLVFTALLLLAGCQGLPVREAAQAPAAAPVLSQVDEVKDLNAIAAALAAAQGRKTLLVLDIDDTLLTSERFFGSDAWYEWEKTLPQGERVLCKFDVIALNYEASTQVLTQADAPALVNALTVDRLLLTSRGANYRGGTLRELAQAKYQLPPTLGQPTRGTMWTWTDPVDQRSATVSYDQGVFMTTGANKGRVLLDLLKERGLSYEHIILADDGRKNIDHMQAALAQAGVSYHGLWYTRIDKTVSPAKAQEGKDGWAAWKTLLQTIYPERWERFNQGKCYN
jgi:hypothetical protein